MKIAHVTSTYPPYKGGIGNTCYHLVEALRLQGHQVSVFTPRYSNKINSVPTPDVVWLRPWGKYGNAAFIPQILWKLRRYDIVHLHYPFLGSELLWVWKIFHWKRKVVLHYQMDLIGRGFSKVLFRLHQIFFLPIFVRFADRILVSSMDYLESSLLLPYYRKHRRKFEGIPNGVDTDAFTPTPPSAELVEKFKLRAGETILFVGGLDRAHYFKGLGVLFDALRVLPTVKVLIVGDGDLRPYYQGIAQNLGIHSQVVFFGKASDMELVECYNLATLVVLPSVDRTEAFGLVLLEAQACRKPVIASNLAGVRTVVRDGVDGFLTIPGNADDLVIKLKTLLADPKLQEQFGRNGREKVLRTYTWPTIGLQLQKVYESL